MLLGLSPEYVLVMFRFGSLWIESKVTMRRLRRLMRSLFDVFVHYRSRITYCFAGASQPAAVLDNQLTYLISTEKQFKVSTQVSQKISSHSCRSPWSSSLTLHPPLCVVRCALCVLLYILTCGPVSSFGPLVNVCKTVILPPWFLLSSSCPAPSMS